MIKTISLVRQALAKYSFLWPSSHWNINPAGKRVNESKLKYCDVQRKYRTD